MKKFALLGVLIFVVATLGCATKINPDEEKAAIQAAKAWLAIVDAGQYEDSWSAGAAHLKSSVTQKRWVETLTAVRKPMGSLVARRVTAAEHRFIMPQVLFGNYVVIQYESAFANNPSATEIITQILEKDGVWRVGGYQLK